MHIHILGICGTFMGGIAQIAASLGHKVSGSDVNVYPPMSDQLESAGINILNGYCVEHLQPSPDLVLIGNAMSRGNKAVEYVLAEGIHYDSGPGWLHDAVLRDKKVIAVAGTHGKTTTTSLITWILEFNGKQPGYLIGGRANNFELTAKLGDGDIFVIEADEYDTAFFDKRSKFLHYQPNVFLLNNLEFDHADIFDDISDIQRQFHHAVRTVPSSGLIIANHDSEYIQETLEMGCWTPITSFGIGLGANWQLQDGLANTNPDDGERYEIHTNDEVRCIFTPPIAGQHNALNTLAALIAAQAVGVTPEQSLNALATFKGVKRRLDNYATVEGIALYDDFAHHPSAIIATLAALQKIKRHGKIHCVLEPRSNTMQNGTHEKTLELAFEGADSVFLFKPSGLQFDLENTAKMIGEHCQISDDINVLVNKITGMVRPGDHIVVMSNGAFEGIHAKLERALEKIHLTPK